MPRLREPLRPGEIAHLEREVAMTRTFDRKTGSVVEDWPEEPSSGEAPPNDDAAEQGPSHDD